VQAAGMIPASNPSYFRESPRSIPWSRRVITLFELSQQRAFGEQFFITCVGYMAFNGGGTTLGASIARSTRLSS
jgi:hypothetical protein